MICVCGRDWAVVVVDSVSGWRMCSCCLADMRDLLADAADRHPVNVTAVAAAVVSRRASMPAGRRAWWRLQGRARRWWWRWMRPRAALERRIVAVQWAWSGRTLCGAELAGLVDGVRGR